MGKIGIFTKFLIWILSPFVEAWKEANHIHSSQGALFYVRDFHGMQCQIQEIAHEVTLEAVKKAVREINSHSDAMQGQIEADIKDWVDNTMNDRIEALRNELTAKKAK